MKLEITQQTNLILTVNLARESAASIMDSRRKEKNSKKQKSKRNEFFRGVGFYMGREGPGLYTKATERLGLFIRSQFKNSSDINKCSMQQKLVKPAIPELVKNHTAHKKRLWEYRMGELMKTESFREGSLYNLFTVLMSLCESNVKSQVECNTNFSKLEKNLDSVGLLCTVEKLVYNGGTNDLNVKPVPRYIPRYPGVQRSVHGYVQGMNWILNLADAWMRQRQY